MLLVMLHYVVVCMCVVRAACTMNLNQIGGWQGGGVRHVLQRHGEGGIISCVLTPLAHLGHRNSALRDMQRYAESAHVNVCR